MSDGTQGRCRYEFDPDAWEKKHEVSSSIDSDADTDILEQGVWRCPHDAIEEYDRCPFHLDPGERPADVDAASAFVEVVTGERDAPPQFVGGVFPEFDLSIDRISVDGCLDLRHVRVGSLDWTGAVIEGEVDASSGEFRADADFESAHFGDTVDFWAAEFGSDANFDSVDFGDDGNFRYAQVGGDASFGSAEFGGDIDFRSVEVGGDANFRSVEVAGDADVWGATFECEARFESAGFEGNATFSGVEFGDRADFSYISFRGDATFSSADFEGEAYYYSATFERKTDFSGAEFGADTTFSSTEFGGGADFSNVEFGAETDFRDCEFGGAVTFSKAVFRAGTDFKITDFGAEADFSGCVFEDAVGFNFAKFGSDTDFRNAEFEAEAHFRNSEFEGKARFRNSVFVGPAGFGRFHAPAIFDHATFQIKPVFAVETTESGETRTVSFDERASFRNARFQDGCALPGLSGGGPTDFAGAELPRSNLRHADLSGADFEDANLSRSALYGADLSNARLHGAILSDVRISDATDFGVERRTGLLPFASPSPDVVYDPRSEPVADTDDADVSNYTRAAAVYANVESLAHDNAASKLASTCYTWRRDMQRKRYYSSEGEGNHPEYLSWARSAVANVVVRYGESPYRVVSLAGVVVLLCGLLYWRLDLVAGAEGVGGPSLVDAMYFSTLTFTTLGLGDFQPVNDFGRALAIFETSAGVVLLALLVFVFGRRATR